MGYFFFILAFFFTFAFASEFELEGQNCYNVFAVSRNGYVCFLEGYYKENVSPKEPISAYCKNVLKDIRGMYNFEDLCYKECLKGYSQKNNPDILLDKRKDFSSYLLVNHCFDYVDAFYKQAFSFQEKFGEGFRNEVNIGNVIVNFIFFVISVVLVIIFFRVFKYFEKEGKD